MKKTLVLMLSLAAGFAMADETTSPLTLKDKWDFSENLTSEKGIAFSTQSAAASYNTEEGYATLVSGTNTTLNGSGGIYLNTTGLDCGDTDWAVQVIFRTPGFAQRGPNTAAQTLLCTANGSNTGVQIAVPNSSDSSSQFVMASSDWGQWSAANRVLTGIATPNSADEWTTLTLLNYNGIVYVANGRVWSENTFGGPGVTLDKLMFGFGKGGVNGVATSSLQLDQVSVYTFDHNQVSLADAQAALPEPATATLSLLALAGLAARRRRK